MLWERSELLVIDLTTKTVPKHQKVILSSKCVSGERETMTHLNRGDDDWFIINAPCPHTSEQLIKGFLMSYLNVL